MPRFDPKILKLFKESKDDLVETTDFLYFDDRGPELALMYSKLFWPDLMEVDGYVFISEKFEPEFYDEIINDSRIKNVECFINTTYLQYMVGTGEHDCADEIWELLGQTLCETWKQRAQFLFPRKSFETEFAWHSEEVGDPGVTLYQPRYSAKE